MSDYLWTWQCAGPGRRVVLCSVDLVICWVF